MKFTNIKQLIIKFMGGGIINFPTRFLRWVKINGDVDGSDDGGGGGGSGDITLADAWTKTFRLNKGRTYDNEQYCWLYNDDEIPLPDLVLSSKGDWYIVQQTFIRDTDIDTEGITIPEGVECQDRAIYEYRNDISENDIQIVPFNEVNENNLCRSTSGFSNKSGNVYFLYKWNKLTSDFSGSKVDLPFCDDPSIGAELNNNIMVVKYNGELYFTNCYPGD